MFIPSRYRKAPLLLLLSMCTAIAEAAGSGAITNIKVENTAAVAQSNVPLTFGQVFAPGELAPTDSLAGQANDGGLLPLQLDIKAKHADGSVRHAVISAVLPALAASQVQTIDLVKATAGPGAASSATVADLIRAGFSASVTINLGGQLYRASADELLKNGNYKTWLAGPITNEWLVSAPLKTDAGVAHPHLTARFAIRSFGNLNKARVDVIVENDWAYQPDPQNFTYDAEVRVGDKSVYTKSALTHFHHARWRKTFWWGAPPQVHVKHNTAYLIASKALPNYDQSITISESALASMKTAWTGPKTEPMGVGQAATYMPTTGGRSDIGLLPGWASMYLLSMDKRAKEVTLGTADLAGSWSSHYRNKDTDRPISLFEYPYMTVLGHPGDTYNPVTKKYESFPVCAAGASCTNANTADSAHQPGFAYLPYLVTGDNYYLEELQFWAMWNTFSSNPGYRENIKGLYKPDQVRGQAWSLRTLSEAAYITPDDDPLKAQFDYFLSSNLDWYNATYTNNPAANKLGAITHGYAIGYDVSKDGQLTGLAPWQDDFFTSAIGHAAELGYAKAKPLLAWKAKFPVSRMTDPSYCWIGGAIYAMKVRDTATGPFYDTIGQAYLASYPTAMTSLACAGPEMASYLGLKVGEMTGYSASDMGYPSNMQPALAYSADPSIPNGAKAWQVFMGRSVKPDYSANPEFAIVPRGGPVCTLSASPGTITAGGSAKLTANCSPAATSYSWTNTGFAATAAGGTVSPTATTTYSVLGSNASGPGNRASVTVTVAPASALTPPACTLIASATTVNPGTAVTLAAKCSPAATSYTWTNTGFSQSATGGTVAPATTTTYSVAGSNAAGKGNSVSVTVTMAPSAALTPPSCTLSASPAMIAAGGFSTLAVKCSPAATSYAWTNTGFGQTVASGTVAPTATTTYSVVGSNAAGKGNSASTTVTVTPNTSPAPSSGYSPYTNYSNDFCSSGNYPAQWTWNPQTMLASPLPATSGTPRMDQIRDGKVIATYTSLGGDAGYSKPDSSNGGDTSVGPFRRQPYTQWKNGDIFEIYPAVYNGAKMQIYLGPNAVNDGAYSAGKFDVPANITIRGVTVDGRRPVIVNPPSGAANSNYGQSLIYVDGRYNSSGELVTPSTNITIENIDIVDSPSGGNIGKAAVYVNGAANLTLRKVRIAGFKQHHANGVFATGNNTGTLLFDNVELDGNGGSGGPEHNAYINASKTDPNFTFAVRGSWSHDSYYGHELKSRAQHTIIEGSYLSGGRATAAAPQAEAYLLDVPDGGTLIARNNIFVKGYSGDQSNGASLTFGVESANPARTWGLTVEHNTFVALAKYFDTQNHPLFPMFIGGSAPGPKTVQHNAFVGYCPTGNAQKDFRGTNFVTLNFNEIDLGFRPRQPLLTGNQEIIGTSQYGHVARSIPRRTKALGAVD